MSIKINLKIFAILIIMYLTRQFEIYIIFMLFAFIHELGHLIAGIILKFKPKSLEIMPVGVCISFKIDCNDYNKKVLNANILTVKKIIIALAGPATNFIIATFFYFSKLKFFNIENEFIVFTNIIIGIFNLIPIYPLDGGRILKCFVHILGGRKKSYEITNKFANISIIVLTILSSIGILLWNNWVWIITIGYLWYLLIKENKFFKEKMRVYSLLEEGNCIK